MPVCPACRSLGMGNSTPGGVTHRERRRGVGTNVECLSDMTTGACFGRVFLRIVKGLRTTRLMPGASRLSAIVSGQDGRSGVTPKRAPILTLN